VCLSVALSRWLLKAKVKNAIQPRAAFVALTPATTTTATKITRAKQQQKLI